MKNLQENLKQNVKTENHTLKSLQNPSLKNLMKPMLIYGIQEE